MDGIPGELVHSLVRAITPHQCLPIPSMAVARLTPLSNKLPVAGTVPPAGLHLQSEYNGSECIFEARPSGVKLWPFVVDSIDSDVKQSNADSKETEHFINIKITSNLNKIPENSPSELTFFISGSVRRAMSAMDSIGCGVISGAMVALDGSWTVPLKKEDFTVLGFESEHRMMPEQHRSKDVASLIQEYMYFPERFCFFKVSGLIASTPCRGFIIRIKIKAEYVESLYSVREKIRLNCIPIINIYKPPAVSLKISTGTSEYTIPKHKLNSKYWDVVAINSVLLQSPEKVIQVSEFRLGVENEEDEPAAITWEQVRIDSPVVSELKSTVGLRLQGIDSAKYHDLRYENAIVETFACNTTAPKHLEIGKRINILGWESGYTASLETTATPYIEYRPKSHKGTLAIIRGMQMQNGRITNLKLALDTYLKSIDRIESPHSKALQNSLISVKRDVVAVPHPQAPLGAMLSMGLCYTLTLATVDGIESGNYLKSRVLALALKALQGDLLPVEVMTYGRDQQAIYV